MAKTVFGRDFHLPAAVLPSVQGPASLPLPAPARATVATRPAAHTPPPSRAASAAAPRARNLTPRPSRKSGEFAAPRSSLRKSSPPAKARFLGRRNTAGNFVPLTQTDLLALPRPAWMRPAFTVLIAAAASFVVVAAVLWGLNRAAPLRSAPSHQSERRFDAAAKAEGKAALPQPAPSQAAPSPPVPAAQESPARPQAETPPAAVAPPAARPKAGKAAARNRVRRAERPIDPDAPLPPTFF